jgi:hypothetical protein
LTFPAGTECYRADVDPVKARGCLVGEAEIDDVAIESVSDVLWDASGTKIVEELLGEVATTEFETAAISEILIADVVEPEDWRVGEAVAQAYLEHHHDCNFPWAPRRDLKNPRGSHPGA